MVQHQEDLLLHQAAKEAAVVDIMLQDKMVQLTEAAVAEVLKGITPVTLFIQAAPAVKE